MLRVTSAITTQKLSAAQQNLDAGRLSKVEDICLEVLMREPNNPDALRMLGMVAMYTNHHADAERLLSRVTAMLPDDLRAWTALGAVQLKRGRIDEMTESFRRAVALAPEQPQAHCNLGYALTLAGQIEESIACYRRALEARPDWQGAYSSLLNTLYFHPGYDARAIYDEHRRWNAAVAQKYTDAAAPHANDRTPGRRLRVGYLSPNLRRHAVGRFMVPIFAHHDQAQFELFAYSDWAAPDDVSQQMSAMVDRWQNVGGTSDDQLAALIRQDRIDILIDLSLHLYENRMLVFARRPAPVQMTYLAYCGTSGLTAMAYRISDPYLDPPGGPDEPFYSEKTVRLPCYWCYARPADLEPAKRPPIESNGRITFGCLNNFDKA